jgi:hypothetical protein
MVYCNLLKSMDLTNREYDFKYEATSSLLGVGQFRPSTIMCCFKELLCTSSSLQSYIKCLGVCTPSLQGHVWLSVNLNLCE